MSKKKKELTLEDIRRELSKVDWSYKAPSKLEAKEVGEAGTELDKALNEDTTQTASTECREAGSSGETARYLDKTPYNLM